MPVLPAVPSTMTPPGRGAVLDRAAGVEELGLAENGAAGRLRGASQLDQRCVADRADKPVAHVHALPPCRRRMPFAATLWGGRPKGQVGPAMVAELCERSDRGGGGKQAARVGVERAAIDASPGFAGKIVRQAQP